MNELINIILEKYEILLYIFVRMTGIFVISPIFSRNNIPNIFKIGFALIVSLLVASIITGENIDYNDFEILIIIIRELIIGIIIGYISYLFFSAFYIAGQIVDTQIGFGMVNVLDPQHNIQIPIMGNFFYIIAILVFLTINGHHLLLKAVVASFQVLQIGQFTINEVVLSNFIKIIAQIFEIGFKISSPVIATIFLANVLLGILARTMPQMNVFIVGMPLKIIIGLLTLVIILPVFILALQHIFGNMYEEIFNFLKVVEKG